MDEDNINENENESEVYFLAKLRDKIVSTGSEVIFETDDDAEGEPVYIKIHDE
jgi:hypothetical protein